MCSYCSYTFLCINIKVRHETKEWAFFTLQQIVFIATPLWPLTNFNKGRTDKNKDHQRAPLKASTQIMMLYCTVVGTEGIYTSNFIFFWRLNDPWSDANMCTPCVCTTRGYLTRSQHSNDVLQLYRTECLLTVYSIPSFIHYAEIDGRSSVDPNELTVWDLEVMLFWLFRLPF